MWPMCQQIHTPVYFMKYFCVDHFFFAFTDVFENTQSGCLPRFKVFWGLKGQVCAINTKSICNSFVFGAVLFVKSASFFEG